MEKCVTGTFRPRVWTLPGACSGACSRPASPQGPCRAAGPYHEANNRNALVDGVTAVETPVVRAIVGRLGSPRILQFAYFFGRAEPGPCGEASRRRLPGDPLLYVVQAEKVQPRPGGSRDHT